LFLFDLQPAVPPNYQFVPNQRLSATAKFLTVQPVISVRWKLDMDWQFFGNRFNQPNRCFYRRSGWNSQHYGDFERNIQPGSSVHCSKRRNLNVLKITLIQFQARSWLQLQAYDFRNACNWNLIYCTLHHI